MIVVNDYDYHYYHHRQEKCNDFCAIVNNIDEPIFINKKIAKCRCSENKPLESER